MQRIRDSELVVTARRAGAVGRQVARVSRDSNITFLAAAVAYYGFVSIVPILLLAVVVGTRVAGPELTNAALSSLGGFLTSSGELVVRDILANTEGQAPATILGILLLGWSATRLFRGMDAAFSAIYGSWGTEPLQEQLVDALLVLGVMAISIVAAVGIGILLPARDMLPFPGVLSTISVFLALCVAFYPAFYRFPDVELGLWEPVPGTLLSAALWTGFTQLFRIYSGFVDEFSLYGVLGAAVLLVTFLYLGATIIMVGAVTNAVLAGRTDDDPSPEELDADRPTAAPDVAELARKVRALELEVDAKTVSRQQVESELKGYVRRRLRRGQARGWGPYLVLLYGTIMTVGAFYYLDGGWAIGAMLVVWLSTLGLYALMLLVGVGIKGAGIPGAIYDRFRSDRS